MPVLTIRYGVILIYDEIVECASKNSMEVMTELSDKFLTDIEKIYGTFSKSALICLTATA